MPKILKKFPQSSLSQLTRHLADHQYPTLPRSIEVWSISAFFIKYSYYRDVGLPARIESATLSVYANEFFHILCLSLWPTPWQILEISVTPSFIHLSSISHKMFATRAYLTQYPLSHDVIITRWGSWVSAATFFANHFQKTLLQDTSTLAADLAFINSYLGFDKLQERGLSLSKQVGRRCTV